MKKQYITITKGWDNRQLSVMISNNGYQWNEVFSGPINKCKILLTAFKKIGFIYIKDRQEFFGRLGGVLT